MLFQVRVDFLGALPYDLGAYLDPIQYAVWKNGEPFVVITNQILGAINHSTALPQSGKAEDEEYAPSAIKDLAEATEAAGAPLPAADPDFCSNRARSNSIHLTTSAEIRTSDSKS